VDRETFENVPGLQTRQADEPVVTVIDPGAQSETKFDAKMSTAPKQDHGYGSRMHSGPVQPVGEGKALEYLPIGH
jgi:hypothetical protein